jgi:hypothetical protein
MDSGFYDECVLRQTAINLFYGWGYNFYKIGNQLRADDQRVRSKAAWLLGMARLSVERAESEYWRAFFWHAVSREAISEPVGHSGVTAVGTVGGWSAAPSTTARAGKLRLR